MDIEGSVALVTGANRGIGLAFARALLSRGAAKVYAGVRNPDQFTEPGLEPLLLGCSRAPWTAPAGKWR
jgi:NAD(P)-dependent dehydrogenase (short-subunit alcohol dehydrogenase family)